LSDISATRARIHTKYYLCTDNVCRRAPSPCGIHRPLGGGGRGYTTIYTKLNLEKLRALHHPAKIIYSTDPSDCMGLDSYVSDMQRSAGASTHYKRWSKCTMEKVGGDVFAET